MIIYTIREDLDSSFEHNYLSVIITVETFGSESWQLEESWGGNMISTLAILQIAGGEKIVIRSYILINALFHDLQSFFVYYGRIIIYCCWFSFGERIQILEFITIFGHILFERSGWNWIFPKYISFNWEVENYCLLIRKKFEICTSSQEKFIWTIPNSFFSLFAWGIWRLWWL